MLKKAKNPVQTNTPTGVHRPSFPQSILPPNNQPHKHLEMPPRRRSNRDQTASDFFIQFPDFTPNPTATLADDFHRLADHRGWTRNSKRWRKMWNQLANLEYDRLIGSTLISLDSWRGLCVEVGLEGGYPSITKCKTVCFAPLALSV